jgi:outer membrane lipoprotein-sorting protein
MRKLSARARWAVPAGVLTAVGVGIAASAVASAAEPSLPPRTVAQLITEVQQAAAKPLGPLTATVQETANLGLPALPQGGALGGQSGPAAMTNPLAGTTTVNIWYRDPQHIRIAEPAPLGESDLRLDGTKLWLWSSKNQTATHVLLPAKLPHAGPRAAPAPSASFPSPAAAARQLLTAAGPSTSFRIGPSATVAGRAAYQLVIAPKGSGSLVSQILIAIDASSHQPLRVQVFAHGSSAPAFQLGFTSLTFGAPAASNFTFSPPPGAKVKTVKIPAAPPGGLAKGLAGLGAAGLGPAALGASPAGAIVGPSSRGSFYSSSLRVSVSQSSAAMPAPAPLTALAARQLRASMIAQLPKSMTGAQRREAIRSLERSVQAGSQTTWISAAGPASASAGSGPPGGPAGQPKVLGSGWTSVLATPANPAVAAAVQQLLNAKTAAALGGVHPQTKTPASAGIGGLAAPIGPDLAVVHALLQASTPVKGSWGSGRLLRTTLLTVLITSKGQILAGAVTPSVLYADAATLSR